MTVLTVMYDQNNNAMVSITFLIALLTKRYGQHHNAVVINGLILGRYTLVSGDTE